MKKVLAWLFGFEGRLGRLPFLAASVPLAALPYVLAWAGAAALTDPGLQRWSLNDPPKTGLGQSLAFAPIVPLAGMLITLVLAWVLAALAFRRARDAGKHASLASLVIVPLLQAAAILVLALPKSVASDPPPIETLSGPDAVASTQGILAGAALSIAGVAAGAIVFGTYGWGVFILTPFFAGWLAAWTANRRRDIGGGDTSWVILWTSLLSSAGLLAFGLEGAVCMILASPLLVIMVAAGGVHGRWLATRSNTSAAQTFSCLAALPLCFATESMAPPDLLFECREAMVIGAPPDKVWRDVVSMDRLESPTPLFRLGVAYPVRAEILGEGVGAVRRGYFSTGVAIERVTTWAPGRELAFVVESEPPAMRELSPYATVHAPHVRGYFRTLGTRFLIEPVSGGRSRLTIVSQHSLRLDPAPYWTPLARQVIRMNDQLVLRSVAARAGGREPS